MAEINISGGTHVKTLKSEFKKNFGLTLRVYDGKKFANEDATLASISESKVEEFSIRSNMHSGNVEKTFLDSAGLTVQVASPNDKELVANAFSLADRKELYSQEKYSHL